MPDPFLYFFFLIGNETCYVSHKKLIQNWVRPRPSQARPGDADHLRPSNLAARNLRSVEHTPSKFGHGPRPVRPGLVAAVQCCMRKACFFAVVEQNERTQSLGCVSTPQKGKPVLFSVFWNDNCRPYNNYRSRKQNRIVNTLAGFFSRGR